MKCQHLIIIFIYHSTATYSQINDGVGDITPKYDVDYDNQVNNSISYNNTNYMNETETYYYDYDYDNSGNNDSTRTEGTQSVLLYEDGDCNGYYDKLYTFGDQILAVSGPNFLVTELPPALFITGCRNKRYVVKEAFADHIREIFHNISHFNLNDVSFWPTLPDYIKIQKVSLSSVTPVGTWGACSEVNVMKLKSCNVSQIPSNWLLDCRKLTNIEFNMMNIEQVTKVLESTPYIKYFKLWWIKNLEYVVWNNLFPPISNGFDQLNEVEIQYIEPENDAAERANTTWSEVSASLVEQLSLLPALESLRLSHITFFDFCPYGNFSAVTFPSLKNLYIWPPTRTGRVCYRDYRKMPKLQLASLVTGDITNLEFGEIFSSRAPNMIVDLESAAVQRLHFHRQDYLMLTDESNRGNVTLDKLKCSMPCDCGESLWFGRALIEGLVTADLITCDDGSAITDQFCNWLYCFRVQCDSTCICCKNNDTLAVDCRDTDILALPEDLMLSANVSEIIASNNSITDLPSSFADELIWLDVSNNDVFKNADEDQMMALFSKPSRIVKLSGNPIICSCDNQLLIDAIQKHRDQVDDYDFMVCAGESKKISEVDVSAICFTRRLSKVLFITLSIALFLAVSGLIVGAAFYYQRALQVFLFSKGWCLSCIQIDDLDSDRLYDVFLSYCFEDQEIVTTELLPRLDNEYTVCVHFRDWYPGEMISTQISNSVEQSRRTIIVLSRAFVKSLWGMLEFRTAHITSITEGRLRVILIILDDVLEDETLEGELRSYIRLNTYVLWGDPWFWDKLRFALPHSPLQRNVGPVISNESGETSDQRLEMIEMLNGGT